jgi:uncharacterized repeat protein (TIGR03803 family)
MTSTGQSSYKISRLLPQGVLAGVLLAGVLFQAACSGSGSATTGTAPANYTFSVLYAFTGGLDGGAPFAGLVQDIAGNLYSTTRNGGNPACNNNASCGVIFKLDNAGEAVLYSFVFPNGASPVAGLVQDTAGNFYGTTQLGGALGQGVVFKLDTAGNETVLYSFTGGPDGGGPQAGLVLDSMGNLFGTARGGGIPGCSVGCGVIFKVASGGGETVLYSFTGGADGGTPYAGLIKDSTGILYGTAFGGGTAGNGVIFKLDTSSTYTVLHSFAGGTGDGQNPVAGLVQDPAGNLYGTTLGGGGSHQGTIFKVDANSNETLLYSFTGGADGAQPEGSLIVDSAGNLYGTTFFAGGTSNEGTVFRLNTANSLAVLYTFTGQTDGGGSVAGLLQDAAGNLYGTTQRGGFVNCSCGVVFKLTVH